MEYQCKYSAHIVVGRALLFTKFKNIMNIYYSEEVHDEVIELSDKHVLWDIEDYDPLLGEFLCNLYKEDFFNKYKTELHYFGRSNRHVCVENTPENRRRVYNMTRTVRNMQNDFIAQFK